MTGWVKIHRKFSDWGWRSKPEMVSLFLHILVEANYEDSIWRGITLHRGQCVFGRLTWSKELGISEQTIRTCMERLKSTNEITIESTNKYSIITIVNYEEYQQQEEKLTSKTTSELTNNQQTTNIQSTTPKEDKNLRNKEDIIKEKNTKKESSLFTDEEIFTLPDWIPKPTWEEFMKIRVKKRAAQTPYALNLLVLQIDKLRKLGHTVQEIIDNSIRNSWVDLFEPKKSQPTGKADKHGNFERQDYRAGIAESGFKTKF